jgi:DNA-binding MarR family transcriptional regulator
MQRKSQTPNRAARAGAIHVLPLSALLSQVLVAFTIEFDNEFEHRMPHRTTNHGSLGDVIGPWLVSLVMWSNCMRFVDERGIRLGELEALARTPTNLDGMRRWRYITIETQDRGTGKKPSGADWTLRATPMGLIAKETWQPLFGVIEERWIDRFGKDTLEGLRATLLAFAKQFPRELPDCLPILGYGLISKMLKGKITPPASARSSEDPSSLPLFALLSRTLLAFAIEFEAEARLSLAISANVLRVLEESGTPLRDLPKLSGVSKEAISMAVGFLKKMGLVVIEPNAAARGKQVSLTATGEAARDAYPQLAHAIEMRWRDHYGRQNVEDLRSILQRLVGEPGAESPLFRGLEPYPEGWRAEVSKPLTLPHYPMVLHRGGFPDGS